MRFRLSSSSATIALGSYCWTSGETSAATDSPSSFLTIAAAFAEAERERIRERVAQVKADQRERGRYLGGKVPFGFRRDDSGALVPIPEQQEAIRAAAQLQAEGK